jgi:hypothetical protein
MTSPESLAAPESAAPASTPLPFPVLLPYAIPTMGLVRSQVSEALLAHMTVYAQGAATLSHAQAVTSLNALRDLLPTCSTIVASKPASRIVPGPGRFLADDAAHDAYFRVCRVSDPEGVAFLRSILMATALFRAEMASTYASLHAQRFAAISSGFAALLGQIAGIRIALVEDTIAESAAAAAVPTAPAGILEGSRADVSFAAGLLVDKFAWHLPLYRQHQRLTASGINVSRPWLTQIAQRTISLLVPIYEAQFASIRLSRVKAMDETPIKAGRSDHGKMQTGYFWPVYGELDEVCFPFHPSRSADFVRSALGRDHGADSVLLTDGYAAYECYAKKYGITHARCWSHSRRGFFNALQAERTGAAEALEQIIALYAIEDDIRTLKLAGEAKHLHRLTHSKPLVEKFFDWVDGQLRRQGFTPKNPFIKALNYVRLRRSGLEVFLTDPDVPIDTNHVERALRVIPMGRKGWLFCWTELGAKHVGIIQSLIVTCRLHGIDPYTHLVDVLQRVAEHPANRVAELTPRLWKQRFAGNPLHSDLRGPPV